jgi:hypothetical protein
VATAAALGVAKLQAGKGGTDDMNPEGGTAYRSMSEAEFEMANKGKWSDSTIAGTARAVPIEDLGTATKIDE